MSAIYKYSVFNNNASTAIFFVAGNNETYLGLQVKCPTLLPDCNKIWSDSKVFHKSTQYEISWKCVPWGVAVIGADGRTGTK
jgi:hypothetical protein